MNNTGANSNAYFRLYDWSLIGLGVGVASNEIIGIEAYALKMRSVLTISFPVSAVATLSTVWRIRVIWCIPREVNLLKSTQ